MFIRLCKVFYISWIGMCFLFCQSLKPVLRIQLILMRIQIRTGKNGSGYPDPDPGYFLKIYWNFLNKAKF